MVVYIIGMPGCGKSKTCRHLATITPYKIIDLDKYIEEKTGMPVHEIFAKYGEGYFRDLEYNSLVEIGKMNENIIVACGAGIVTNLSCKEVMTSGPVVFFDGDLDLLRSHLANTEHIRPLLKAKSIEQIYEERIDLYRYFADYTIKYIDYEGAANKVLEIISGVHKKRILVVNGPNLNMLGLRDPKHYGSLTLDELNQFIAKDDTFDFEFFQSNCEGSIIDKLQTYQKYDAIIINPAAYTHTSVAIHDCLEAISIPKVEVHLSDVDNREDYRRVNFIHNVVDITFSGKKEGSYLEAINYLKNKINVL